MHQHAKRVLTTIAIIAALAAAVVVTRLVTPDQPAPAVDTTYDTYLTADLFTDTLELRHPTAAESLGTLAREGSWTHEECPLTGDVLQGCDRAVEALYLTGDGEFRVTVVVLVYITLAEATSARDTLIAIEDIHDGIVFPEATRPPGPAWWWVSDQGRFVVVSTTGRADGGDLSGPAGERAESLVKAINTDVALTLREGYR